MRTWAILTGEYPPKPGGVSDYTSLVARELAAAGDTVHVFAPPPTTSAPAAERITIHALLDHYGPQGRAQLTSELAKLPQPLTILVQYVPHSYGHKAMNVGFARWVRRQGRVLTMFHEIVYPLTWRQPMKHNILGVVTRYMAKQIIKGSSHMFFSIPAWHDIAKRLGGHNVPATWLPVPSNVATEADAGQVAGIRARLEHPLIGHFGTYGPNIVPSLDALFPQILGDSPDARLLLLGHGGDRYLRELNRKHPGLATRITATGPLDASTLAAYLKACDLLVQPYPDGASCRRGSLMGGLALGCAIVTTTGPLTEKIWFERQAVAFAPPDDMRQVAAQAKALLADADERQAMGNRAAALYRERFSLACTVRMLREVAAQMS